MTIIYKYALPPTDKPTIHLPKGAKILTIQAQQNLPQIWAEVNPDEKETEAITFRTFGTGREMTGIEPGTHLEYVGTWQINEGLLVFHTYKVVVTHKIKAINIYD